jgi:hypothetical protein
VSLLNIWTPTDIKNGQSELLASASATDTAVQACPGIDATKRSEWSIWFVGAKKFCAEVPVLFFPTGSNEVIVTGTLADQLQQYQKELLAWQQQFSSLGRSCSFSPMIAVDNGPPIDFGSIVKYGSVAAMLVATAVIVSKIVDLLPKRAAA